jgi:hypothetical protein
MCFYILLHEPELSIVTTLIDSVSVVFLLDLVNLNFSFFCSVFFKLRKFHQPKDNSGEKHSLCVFDFACLVERLKTLVFDCLVIFWI